MIVRVLIRLALLFAIGWWLSRLFRALRSGTRRRTVSPPPDQSMVRDRVCNTFLPRSSAIETRIGKRTYYFCSDECRQRFLQDSEAAPAG